MNQTKNPFEERWPQLLELFELGGPEKILGHIQASQDPIERRALFLMSSQRISNSQGVTRTLDDVITISRAAITEFCIQSSQETDTEERERRLEGANILSYNLAADLAPCWPEDSESRETRHYEEGIRCAEDCLEWRSLLQKGALPFSMAWWALGTHRCGLSDWTGACEAYEKSLEAAQVDAQENSSPTNVSPESSFSINIANGWLEFARWRGGDETSYNRFLEVIAAFRHQIDQKSESREDALIGIQQLETAALRLPGS